MPRKIATKEQKKPSRTGGCWFATTSLSGFGLLFDFGVFTFNISAQI